MSGLLQRVRRWMRRKPSVVIDALPVLDVDELMREFEQHVLEEVGHPKATALTKPRKRPATADSCPTPRKVKYASLAAAKSHRSWKANKGARMRAYKCPCGSWHLARRES